MLSLYLFLTCGPCAASPWQRQDSNLRPWDYEPHEKNRISSLPKIVYNSCWSMINSGNTASLFPHPPLARSPCAASPWQRQDSNLRPWDHEPHEKNRISSLPEIAYTPLKPWKTVEMVYPFSTLLLPLVYTSPLTEAGFEPATLRSWASWEKPHLFSVTNSLSLVSNW